MIVPLEIPADLTRSCRESDVGPQTAYSQVWPRRTDFWARKLLLSLAFDPLVAGRL